MKHGRIVEVSKKLGVNVRVVARVSKGHQQNWSREAELVRAELMATGEAPECIRPVKRWDRWLDESFFQR